MGLLLLPTLMFKDVGGYSCCTNIWRILMFKGCFTDVQRIFMFDGYLPVVSLFHLLAGEVRSFLDVLTLEHLGEGSLSLLTQHTVLYNKRVNH